MYIAVRMKVDLLIKESDYEISFVAAHERQKMQKKCRREKVDLMILNDRR